MYSVVLTCCVYILLPLFQLEALKQQNSKYQEELSLTKERSSSENQRIGVLCKEM